jgi:superfamily I DNA/RNA helicase
LDAPGIRKLIYCLRLTLEPTDPVALRALLALHGGIGPARTKPIIDGAIRSGHSDFLTAVRASTDQRVQAVLEDIGSMPPIQGDEPALEVVERLASALAITQIEKNQFLELARGIIGDEPDLTISAFLTVLAEFRVAPQPGPKQDSGGPVRIMTLRQAKGLSAPVVIVTDLDDEIVPGTYDADQVNEQRRLLYVSMTRAERQLYLFYCGHRSRHASRWAGTGSRRRPYDERTISRFLEGLDIPVFTIDQLVQA